MGAFAVPLPRQLALLIGYAGAGRWGRDPSSQKGLGAPLREGGCLATGRWLGGYPASRARGAARPQPTHSRLWLGADLRLSSPAGGSRRPPRARRGKTGSPRWGPRPCLPTSEGPPRLPRSPSLCGAPAAIVSGRGMEDLAVPHRHVQGLWGIERQAAVSVGGLQPSASRKGPGMAFPRSDRRLQVVSPSPRPSWKP